MRAEAYHASMQPLIEACPLAESGWVCILNPLVGWWREGSFFWKVRVLLRHFELILKIWLTPRKRVLVREFSTIPLLIVFPFLFPFRSRIYFLIHHNLQWAEHRSFERLALKILSRLGARWALLETQDFDGMECFNIPSGRNLIIPHPAAACLTSRNSGEQPVVGVAGYYRREKRIDELIDRLQTEFPSFRIVLGVPNPDAVSHLKVEVIPTASDVAYQEMLSLCDVLVLNGAKGSYFYRASGPIVDAAAVGTAVVAPDYPVIRGQIMTPEPIGEVFDSNHPMDECIRRAIEKKRAGQYAFMDYCQGRSVRSLANCLDRFANEAC